jgi:photosystem II stability/assembly factor-like uncharacterized protein
MRSITIAFAFALTAVAAFGQTSAWQPIVDSKPTQRVNIAGFIDEKRGVTAGYAGATYYTEDSGGSWIKASSASLCRYGLEIVDDGAAITCGQGGDNRVSLDGWRTWKAMRTYGPSEPDHFRFLSFPEVKTGWAAGPSQLSSTQDSGATWSDIKPPRDADRIAAIDLLPGERGDAGFLLDSSGALHLTEDGGATWSSEAISVLGVQLSYTSTMTWGPSAALRFKNREEGILIAYRASPEPAWVALSTADGGATWKVEELTNQLGPASSVYLSRDGRYATLYYSHRILAFKRAAGN